MYENMYLVTENEFHRCQIDGTTQNTKKVMDCNTPINNYALKYHRFWFSDFTTPNGIPFYAGSTYYFIGKQNNSYVFYYTEEKKYFEIFWKIFSLN